MPIFMPNLIGPAAAAVMRPTTHALTAVYQGDWNDNQSVTLTSPVASRYVVALVCWEASTTVTLTGVTLGGVAMARLGVSSPANSTNNAAIEAFGLISTSGTSVNCNATWTGTPGNRRIMIYQVDGGYDGVGAQVNHAQNSQTVNDAVTMTGVINHAPRGVSILGGCFSNSGVSGIFDDADVQDVDLASTGIRCCGGRVTALGAETARNVDLNPDATAYKALCMVALKP